MDSDISNDGNNSSKSLPSRFTFYQSENIFQCKAEKKVFDNPMLLEEILKYLILNNDENMSKRMIQTARLVQKSWLKTTTNVLKKSVTPVISLILNENNSLDGSDVVQNNGKRLDQFVSIFGTSNRLQDSLLPFKLNLTLEYFREENQQSLANCLTHLANELIEIQVTFPRDGGSMPIMFPPLSLPFLRKLSFQFSAQEYQKRPGDIDTPTYGNNQNGLWLLQILLNASVNLRELTVPWSKSNVDLVPRNFELLVLPPSITAIALILTLRNKHLDVLLKNQLPYLKHLLIRVQKVPLENDRIFRILDCFRTTLISFQVCGATVNCASRPSTVMKFPLMEKLETVRIISTKCELETDNPSLHTLLPKVQNVWLAYQTKALLEKWIQGPKLESVKNLALSLVKNHLMQTHSNYFQSISLEMIEQVHETFPNITNLSLTLNIRDMNCLKYVFKKMLKLQSFVIEFKGNIGDASKYYIDSKFLGFPLKLVEALRDHSDYFNSFKLNQDKEPSIVNLSELSVLTLRTNEVLSVPVNDEAPILSDLFFTAGLLKMPKLLHLKLNGTFKISMKSLEMWTKQGRVITRSGD